MHLSDPSVRTTYFLLQFGQREGGIVATEASVRRKCSDSREKSRGIIPCVVRLRNSVGTTAVKSPDQMRDVAQIGCDQPRAIRVEDPAGKLGRLRKPKLRRLSERVRGQDHCHFDFVMRRREY